MRAKVTWLFSTQNKMLLDKKLLDKLYKTYIHNIKSCLCYVCLIGCKRLQKHYDCNLTLWENIYNWLDFYLTLAWEDTVITNAVTPLSSVCTRPVRWTRCSQGIKKKEFPALTGLWTNKLQQFKFINLKVLFFSDKTTDWHIDSLFLILAVITTKLGW